MRGLSAILLVTHSSTAFIHNNYSLNRVPFPFETRLQMHNDPTSNGHSIIDTSHGIIVTSSATTTSDVLSTQDIVDGTIIALILAFGYSFLNGQSSSSSFVSWPSESKQSGDVPSFDIDRTELGDDDVNKVFDADNWKEMSREENYVLYNTKIRRRRTKSDNSTSIRPIDNKENRLVLVALLVLFVPIFSIEFFFALSRQFICEMGMGGDAIIQDAT